MIKLDDKDDIILYKTINSCVEFVTLEYIDSGLCYFILY